MNAQRKTLEYERRQPRMPGKHPRRWLLAGVLLEPVLLVVTVVAGDGGHGSFLPFQLFFSPGIVIAGPVTHEATHAAIVMFGMGLQFSLYGVILFLADKRGRLPLAAVILAIFHVACVVIASCMGFPD